MSVQRAKVRRGLDRVLGLISAAEEQIDKVLWMLEKFEASEAPQWADGRRAVPPPQPLASLVVGLRSDGTGRVVADGGEAFDLPPRLTTLLLFALSGKPGPDGIRSFRPLSEAAKELGSNRNALSSLVYQLRKKLGRHGLNQWLLEVVRRRDGGEIRFRARELLVIAVDDDK